MIWNTLLRTAILNQATFFVSIGTGNSGIKEFEDIATETEETEKRFIARWRKHYDEKRYIRFKADQDLHTAGLD